ncbi:MAG: hypothetical protein QGI10_07120 [Vicinamibacterales bacterium]|nr:hypothetical protein [Vicinamibacterales bacterium]MDP7479024.1 hypothetical protein [Vicinamibacterales bacterium]HJN43528.1 hypothetical protein [Vicinamibacterales bacterium]
MSAVMKRRDLLLLRTAEHDRVVELSCERLFMRYNDARAIGGQLGGAEGAGDAPWDGEPPTDIEERTCEELFQDLDRELRGADVLRVLDRNWLVGEELRQEVDALLAAFRARGGRVEFPLAMVSSLSGGASTV